MSDQHDRKSSMEKAKAKSRKHPARLALARKGVAYRKKKKRPSGS
jgi:hypothetical protein